MSRQRECLFIEPEPDKWYMLLDDSDIANAWDWRENADCYGPFATEESAYDELDHHSNPGGYSILRHGEFKMDDVLRQRINRARRPSAHRIWPTSYGPDRSRRLW